MGWNINQPESETVNRLCGMSSERRHHRKAGSATPGNSRMKVRVKIQLCPLGKGQSGDRAAGDNRKWWKDC
uniref:Uncharacterized protein n=1 Tax=Cannabis sativa TaxID=3483 RepID=A0A803Q7Q8_CANSA